MSDNEDQKQDNTGDATEDKNLKKSAAHKLKQAKGEIGGPKGLEPTRYGDWERKGIVSDF
jgi:hypothetical protein